MRGYQVRWGGARAGCVRWAPCSSTAAKCHWTFLGGEISKARSAWQNGGFYTGLGVHSGLLSTLWPNQHPIECKLKRGPTSAPLEATTATGSRTSMGSWGVRWGSGRWSSFCVVRIPSMQHWSMSERMLVLKATRIWQPRAHRACERKTFPPHFNSSRWR